MSKLTQRAQQVLEYLQRKGDASSRDAFLDIDINSGSFTKRISEIRSAGYPIRSETRRHPTTGRRYVRYHYAAHA